MPPPTLNSEEPVSFAPIWAKASKSVLDERLLGGVDLRVDRLLTSRALSVGRRTRRRAACHMPPHAGVRCSSGACAHRTNQQSRRGEEPQHNPTDVS